MTVLSGVEEPKRIPAIRKRTTKPREKSPAFPVRALAVQAVIHSAAWEEGHPPGHPVLACACGKTFFRDSSIGAASIGRA